VNLAALEQTPVAFGQWVNWSPAPEGGGGRGADLTLVATRPVPSRSGKGRAGSARAISVPMRAIMPLMGHGRSLCPSLPVSGRDSLRSRQG